MARTASSNKSSAREHSPRRGIRVFSAGWASGLGNRAVKPLVRVGFEVVVLDSCSADVSSAYRIGAATREPGGKRPRQIHCDFDNLPASSVGARLCL